MEVIILAVIVGLGISYFATQNTAGITIHFLSYVWPNIPVYLVVIGALLAGLILAWIFYLLHSLSSSFRLKGKENKLKEANKNIAELSKEIHKLELENEHLKGELGETTSDDKSI